MFLCQVSSKRKIATIKSKHHKSSEALSSGRFDASSHQGDGKGAKKIFLRFQMFFPRLLFNRHLQRCVKAQKIPPRSPGRRTTPKRRKILETRWTTFESKLSQKCSVFPSSATYRHMHLRSFIQTPIAETRCFHTHARTHQKKFKNVKKKKLYVFRKLILFHKKERKKIN